MKPVLQAVLFLGLVTPCFSVTPEVNFDGASKKSFSITQELATNSLKINSILPLPVNTADGISASVAIKSESGEWIEQKPEKVEDKVTYYTFLPDAEIKITYSCTSSNPDPNLNYWQVSAKHTNFPSNAGHINHPAVPSLITPAGTVLPNPITSRITPVNTSFVYYWDIPYNYDSYETFLPAYATKISQDATFSYACTGVSTMIFDMKVPNLVELTKGPGYELVGADVNHHPKNHFGTAAMNTAVKKLAADFDAVCTTAAVSLSYNDMSLAWGGLYDLNNDWRVPHREHRFGVNIDVGKRQIKKANRKKFIELACGTFNVRSEGDVSSEPKAHYHLTLKSAAKHIGDELVTFDVDPRYTNCCPASAGAAIPDKCMDLYDGGDLVTEQNTPTDCQ